MYYYLELTKKWRWVKGERHMIDPNSEHMEVTQDAMQALRYKIKPGPEDTDMAGEFLNKEHLKSCKKAHGLVNKTVNMKEPIMSKPSSAKVLTNRSQQLKLDNDSTQSSIIMASGSTSKSKVDAAVKKSSFIIRS